MEFNIEDIIQFTPEEKEQQNTNDTTSPEDQEIDNNNSDTPDTPSDAPETEEEDNDGGIPDAPDESDDEDSGSAVDLKEFFTTLKDSNYLTVPEDFTFDGTTDSLAEAIDLTYESFKKSAQESLLNSLDEDSRLALKFALTYKKPIYSFYEETEVEPFDFSTIDLDELENQQEVVRTYLKKTTAFSDNKIENQIKSLSQSGEIVSEAKEYLGELIAFQEKERQELNSKIEQQRQKDRDDLLKWKEDRVNIIKAYKDADDTRKAKLKAFVVNEVYTDRSKAPVTELVQVLRMINNNPEHYVQLADVLMDYSPEKGIDYDRLTKRLNTKITSSLKDKLDDTAIVPKGKQIRKKIEEEFNWDEWAKQLQ